ETGAADGDVRNRQVDRHWQPGRARVQGDRHRSQRVVVVDRDGMALARGPHPATARDERCRSAVPERVCAQSGDVLSPARSHYPAQRTGSANRGTAGDPDYQRLREEPRRARRGARVPADRRAPAAGGCVVRGGYQRAAGRGHHDHSRACGAM
ncbi:MAG: hypothetical protein AVDCRST_MAG87-3561, partial [uncultured Thermomicrobiales bacterium]